MMVCVATVRAVVWIEAVPPAPRVWLPSVIPVVRSTNVTVLPAPVGGVAVGDVTVAVKVTVSPKTSPLAGKAFRTVLVLACVTMYPVNGGVVVLSAKLPSTLS